MYPGGKPVLQAWNVVKGCAPEMISRTFKDHNLGGQPGQLATGKLQGGSKHAIVDMLRAAKNSVIRLYKLKIQEIRWNITQQKLNFTSFLFYALFL